MKVYDILRKKGGKVITIQQNRKVFDAICTLVENNIGSVIVVDEKNNVVGILTERDILRLTYRDAENFKDKIVKDVMTRDLIVGTPDDDLEYVEKIMTVNRIRHYPIFERENLIGIVSIGDVVKHQLGDLTVENRHLRDYIEGKYPG